MQSVIRTAIVAAAAATLAFSGAVVADVISPEGARTVMPQTGASGVVVQTQFIPIEPCRIANTRNSNAGILQPNVARILRVAGTAGFHAQGGKAGGCGIPDGAKAVVVSLTTVNSAAAGRLTVFPQGSPKPNTIAMSYAKASSTVEITAKLGVKGRIRVVPTKATNLFADVVGYYAEPIAVLVNASGTILSRSAQVTSATKVATGQYRVVFNTRIQYCVASATASNLAIIVAAFTDFNADSVDVYTVNASGQYADAWFFLTVTC